MKKLSMMGIICVAAGMAIAVTPDGAAGCGFCEENILGHTFNPLEFDVTHQCFAHGGCHLSSDPGDCSSHEDCGNRQEDFLAAMQAGDTGAARYHLRRMETELFVVDLDRQILLLRDCGGEFFSAVSLGLHGLADMMDELNLAPADWSTNDRMGNEAG